MVLLNAWHLKAMAADVETLPRHIHMGQIKSGYIAGLDQVWASNGQLYNLGEARSVSFDGATLARVSPQAAQLVAALNQFGSRGLGDQIQMGTLNIETDPSVTYMAPVLAYGLTQHWTVGAGIPVVNYSNHLTLSASASNLSFYRDQLGGNTQLLDDALNVNLVNETRKVIMEKGYRPLQSRDDTFLGDIQLAALHRLKDIGSWAAAHQMTLTLPTGPKDDPDDLMSINAFGRTVFDNTLVLARPLSAVMTVVPYGSLSVTLPDRVTKRVPKNEDDVLPDANSKQDVVRFISPSMTLGSDIRYRLSDIWNVSGGLEGTLKGSDHYSGEGRVDLLARNSDAYVARVRGGVGYSSVDQYKAGKAMIPGRLSVDVSDTIAGRNIERQLRTDFSATLFF